MNIATLELETTIIEQTGLPLVEKTASLQVSPLETYRQKIWRHLKAGQVDLRTLGSGLHQLRHQSLPTPVSDPGHFTAPTIINNYLGIEGLIRAEYDFIENGFLRNPAILYDFPEEAKFQVCAISEPRNSVDYFKQAITDIPSVIAYFTGPTSEWELPNNGFYFRGYQWHIEFGETNPPGQRRGAFATSEEGGLVIMGDAAKWALIRAGYPKIQSLVGGAAYFTDQDRAWYHSGGIGDLSYLFQYRNKNKVMHTGFVLFKNYATRPRMQELLTDYVTRIGRESFIALEMEYVSSSCFIKGQTSLKGGLINRLDHYLVTI